MNKNILIALLIFLTGLAIAYLIVSLAVSTPKRYSIESKDVKQTPIPIQKPLTILFGGDLMFDRNIRIKTQQSGTDIVFKELLPLFSQYDVVIANLEGPITNNPSRSVGSEVGSTNNFIFTFDPNTVAILNQANMKIVNLGNNHITNFGIDGVTQTKKYLEDGNIAYFGDTGEETTSAERVLLQTIKGKQLAFVNYNQFITQGYEHALEDITFATSKSDLVIVYTHWGNEYEQLANSAIQNQAHEFIDLGADVVIGSHPHVTQQKEVYKNKTIYYSLGNFVFDQYFSKETQEGLLVEVIINDNDELLFKEYPIFIKPTGETVLQNVSTPIPLSDV